MSKNKKIDPQSLIESGRAFASELLSEAIEFAADSEDIPNRVALAEMMAVNLLATIILNSEANAAFSGADLLERVFTQIRTEYAYMKQELSKGNLEHVKTETRTPKGGTTLH